MCSHVAAQDVRFARLELGGLYQCGVLQDDTVQCWNLSPDQEWVPDAPVLDFSSKDSWACAVLDGGEIRCLHDYGADDPPAGSFRQVSMGHYFGCAISDAGEIECWQLFVGE
jgi:hypothetical protein